MEPTPPPSPEPSAADFPAEVPHPARIYNYASGGSHWFPADREAAEAMFSLIPSMPKWLRMVRAFLPAVARRLREDGFTRFADFASGLPTEDHVHAVVPDARVVYSDVDPYTLSRAADLVGHLPNVRYLHHDVHQARALLERPEVAEFLSGGKLALGLSGISVFLAPDEFRRIFRDLYEWAPSGTRLYATYETKLPGAMTPPLRQFIDALEATGAQLRLYTREECIEYSRPWSIPEGGMVPLAEFLGMPPGHVTDADREGVGLEFYAAILEKP